MSEPKKPGTALATNDLSRDELFKVLKSSLFPGAAETSVAMVLDYCRAAGLDVMKKPVHIVPMSVSTGAKNQYGAPVKETRDVVIPGIGLYRTDAARTGEYVGLDEPVFGPMVTLHYMATKWVPNPNNPGKNMKVSAEASIEYPEWCQITIKRLVAGEVRNYTAREYWIENYATDGCDSDAPNEMWRKRPRGQLMKCAEAQALRKAFPEQTGSQPTAEEMEGRAEVHMGQVDEVGKKTDDKKTDGKPELKVWTDELFVRQYKNAKAAIQNDDKDPEEVIRAISTRGRLTEEQAQSIRDLAKVTDVVAKGEAPAAGTSAPANDDAHQEPTYESLLARVENATTTDELDEVMPLVQRIPVDQREDLFDKIDDQRGLLLGA